MRKVKFCESELLVPIVRVVQYNYVACYFQVACINVKELLLSA